MIAYIKESVNFRPVSALNKFFASIEPKSDNKYINYVDAVRLTVNDMTRAEKRFPWYKAKFFVLDGGTTLSIVLFGLNEYPHSSRIEIWYGHRVVVTSYIYEKNTKRLLYDASSSTVEVEKDDEKLKKLYAEIFAKLKSCRKLKDVEAVRMKYVLRRA